MARFAIVGSLALFPVACDPPPSPPPPQVVAPKSDGPASSETPLFVYVAADGVVRVDGRDLLDDGAILQHARSYQESHVRGMAIVRSDVGAIHGRTIRIVELLQEARIASVAIDHLR